MKEDFHFPRGKVAMTIQMGGAEKQRIAQVVKDACLQAALEGYENAAMSGLCREGAWEAAISAIKMLDVETILTEKLID
ncbi:MAG: acetyltransferase [Pseudomonadota bacterium]